MYDAVRRIGDFRDVPDLPTISKVVVHNGVVYTSGVVGEPGGDITTQTAQVLERIDELLSLASSNRSLILSAQVWLSDMSDFPAHNAVWDQWVDSNNPPARACVGAQLYDPRLLVEIRVVAVTNDGDPAGPVAPAKSFAYADPSEAKGSALGAGRNCHWR
jgi:enamine deaminase RidA (YjgF/YER057c/UK114 family)